MSKKYLSLIAVLITLLPQMLLGGSVNSATSNPRIFNERFVLRAVRTLHGAEATYQATSGNGNYGSLGALEQSQLIDSALATGNKFGYIFVVSVTPFTTGSPATLTVTATPRAYRKTGRRSFFIDTSGVMRGADKGGQLATVADPIIDECTNGAIGDNERCTISDMRALHAAQTTYAATVGAGNYGSFPQLYQAGLIRSDLANYVSRGYLFTWEVIYQSPNNPATFKIWAVPQAYGTSAIRSFYIDQTGVLHGGDKQGQRANENDPTIND